MLIKKFFLIFTCGFILSICVDIYAMKRSDRVTVIGDESLSSLADMLTSARTQQLELESKRRELQKFCYEVSVKIRKIIDGGERLEVLSAGGQDLLMVALELDDDLLVEKLLEYGVSVDASLVDHPIVEGKERIRKMLLRAFQRSADLRLTELGTRLRDSYDCRPMNAMPK